MIDAKEIGRRLRYLRDENDLTAIEICRRTGIAQSAYSNYETGLRVPRDENKVKLARMYGLTVDTIFFNENFT